MDEVEEKARQMGWVGQDEWKGDPEKWRPAEEFVERGENIIPILKDRLNKLEEELKITLKVNKAEIEAVKKATLEQAKKDYEKQLADLRKQKFEAVQSGDVEEYTKIEQKEKTLRPPEEAKPTESPVFVDWKSKNSWYGAETDLTDWAEFVAAKIHKENPNMEERAFYESVASRVKAQFPDKFTNPNRDKADMVEGGGAKPSGGKKKSWADLPDSAKSAYSRLAKKFEDKGRKLDKDTYVKEYFEE
jgi:hypothetical protein